MFSFAVFLLKMSMHFLSFMRATCRVHKLYFSSAKLQFILRLSNCAVLSAMLCSTDLYGNRVVNGEGTRILNEAVVAVFDTLCPYSP